MAIIMASRWNTCHELYSLHVHVRTRIPSGIWSHLRAMCERRVSSQHMVKSLTLNPYMNLFNLKLWTHIWSTNINFRPPPTYIGLFGPSWSELSPYGWIAGGGVCWAGDIFFVRDGQKRDYLSCASQRARGATKNSHRQSQPLLRPGWLDCAARDIIIHYFKNIRKYQRRTRWWTGSRNIAWSSNSLIENYPTKTV